MSCDAIHGTRAALTPYLNQERDLVAVKTKLILMIAAVALLLSSCAPIGPTGYPAVAVNENTAYLANGTGIYAIDVRNGTLVWRYPEKTDAAKILFAAPAVFNDLVVAGDYANVLHALSVNSGVEQWSFTGAKGRYIGRPLVVGETLLVPNGDFSLYALNNTGNLVWSYKTEQALWANPVSDGTVVYQASLDHYLYALDVTSGKLLWKTDLGGALIGSPTLGENGVLYQGSLANQMSALDTKTGKILWQQATEGAVWASPVLVDGALYFGDQNGILYAKSITDGSPLWQMSVESAVVGSGTVLGDNILFGTDKGRLQAITPDGKIAWTRETGGRLLSHLISTPELALVGVLAGDYHLLAYTPTGETAWSFVAPK